VGAEAEGECLFHVMNISLWPISPSLVVWWERNLELRDQDELWREVGQHTPLTILVPTLVICPLILSLLGLEITSVLPGSIGASSA